MKKIKMIIELECHDEIMHDTDQETIDWFNNYILLGKIAMRSLHSNEIGNYVGKVEGIEILDT